MRSSHPCHFIQVCLFAAVLWGVFPAAAGGRESAAPAPSREGEAAAEDAGAPKSPADAAGAEEKIPSEERREELLDQFFKAHYKNREHLDKAVRHYRKAGLSEYALLEGRLLYVMKSFDWAYFQELLPEFETARKDWVFASGQLCVHRQQLRSFIEMMKARVAYDNGDVKGFEKHLKEAFWLNPQLAKVFRDWIFNYHVMKAMKDRTFPMNLEVQQAKGPNVTLAQVAGEKTAVFMLFWTRRTRACLEMLPRLAELAIQMNSQDAVVAGVNINSQYHAKKYALDSRVHWLVEPADHPLSELLAVDSYPHAALITPDGRIHFTGHPKNPQLKVAFASLGLDFDPNIFSD